MRLGGLYGLGEILKSSFGGQDTLGWNSLWVEWSHKTPCKHFKFGIGRGMKCMKCLKQGAGKGFIFHAIIPVLYPLW